MNCTLVVGVDGYHLDQLSWTWLTWKKNKPSLLKMPMLVFRDLDQVSEQDVLRVVDHPDLLVVEWPPPGVVHAGGSDKWTDPQRYKMLSGFVHVPASRVKTDYWTPMWSRQDATTGLIKGGSREVLRSSASRGGSRNRLIR